MSTVPFDWKTSFHASTSYPGLWPLRAAFWVRRGRGRCPRPRGSGDGRERRREVELNGTAVQLFSLQSADGFVFWSYFCAPFVSVPVTVTLPSA